MVCDFINCIVTIFSDVEMLHNKILGPIGKMWSRVDIEDDKKTKEG
jgi:hypothetical protein